jgi:hypothetical protein
MFRRLGETRGNVLGCQFSGIVTDAEFRQFAAAAKRLIAAEGKIRLLILMDYPQDFEPRAAWDDVLFWVEHIREIERLAIVGQGTWEKRIEPVEKLLLQVEIKYYDTSHLDDAWAWLNERAPV